MRNWKEGLFIIATVLSGCTTKPSRLPVSDPGALRAVMSGFPPDAEGQFIFGFVACEAATPQDDCFSENSRAVIGLRAVTNIITEDGKPINQLTDDKGYIAVSIHPENTEIDLQKTAFITVYHSPIIILEHSDGEVTSGCAEDIIESTANHYHQQVIFSMESCPGK